MPRARKDLFFKPYTYFRFIMEKTTHKKTASKSTSHQGTGTGRLPPRPGRGGRSGGMFGGKRTTPGAGGGFGGAHTRRATRRSGGDRSTEFSQKVLNVRRVARVVSGGRRFSFSVVVVIGDKNGSVGLGIGKASDTALAIEKALRDAKRHMIKVPRTKTNSLPHEVYGSHGSSKVFIFPAKGRGLTAGSSVRAVLDLAGVGSVTAKILSPSKNKLNNARATIQALQGLRTRRAPVETGVTATR